MSARAECELQYKDRSDVVGCYEKESFQDVESKLSILKRLSTSQIPYNKSIISELDISQKNWLAYRDSYCTTYSNYHSEPFNYSNCIITLNKQRSEQLQQNIDTN